jgi:hypothetical protein
MAVNAERSDTPWYGSARLLRQPRVGDWASVFEKVPAELRQVVRGPGGVGRRHRDGRIGHRGGDA